jgi:predicted dehydrogenase
MSKIKMLCLGLSESWISEWVAREDVETVGAVDLYHELDHYPSPIHLLPDYLRHMNLYSDLVVALNEFKPDIITMVTPANCKTNIHAIERVVGMGNNIFLEKFRPADPKDGQRLKCLSETSGKVIGIGQSYVFNKHVFRIKQMLSEGIIGKIEEVIYTCHRPVINDDWVLFYRHVMLEDLSYHHFGVIHYLIHFPCRIVYARSSIPSWSSNKSRDNVSLIAQSIHGVHLTYYSSWAAHGHFTSWLGEFRIEGSEGALCCENEQLYYVNKQGESIPVASIEPFPSNYSLMIQSFLDTDRDPSSSDLTIDRFYPVIEMIYAALESAERNKPIHL